MKQNTRTGEVGTIITLLVLVTIAIGALLGAQQGVRDNITRLLPRAGEQACSFSARAEVREGTVTGPMIAQSAASGWTITNSKSRILPMDTHPDGAWTVWSEEPLRFKDQGGDFDKGEKAWVVLSGQNLQNDYHIKQLFCSSAGVNNACPQNLTDQNNAIAQGGPGHTITDFTVDCDSNITYGWVVESRMPLPTLTPTPSPSQVPPTATPPTATPTPSPQPSVTPQTATPTPLACTLTSLTCEPKNVTATISDTSHVTIRWDYPTTCAGLHDGTDEFMINIRDGNNAVVCGKTVTAQSANTTTTCTLGQDSQRVTRTITSWVSDRYRIEVIAKKAPSTTCTGIPGIGYLTYVEPSATPGANPIPTGNASCPANEVSGRTIYQNALPVTLQTAYVDALAYSGQSAQSYQPQFSYSFTNLEAHLYTFLSSVYKYYKNSSSEGWYEYKPFISRTVMPAACQLADTISFVPNTQCDDINCPKAVAMRDEVYRDYGICTSTQQSLNRCGVYLYDGPAESGSSYGCVISFSDKLAALHETIHYFQTQQNGLTADQQVAFVKKVASIFKNSPEVPAGYISYMSQFFPQGCRNFKALPDDYPTNCAQNTNWKELHAYIGESIAYQDPKSAAKFVLARTKEYYQNFFCDVSKLPAVTTVSGLVSDQTRTTETQSATSIPAPMRLSVNYNTGLAPDSTKMVFAGSIITSISEDPFGQKAEGKAVIELKKSGQIFDTIVTDADGAFAKALSVSKQGDIITATVKNQFGVTLSNTSEFEIFPELYYVFDFRYSLPTPTKTTIVKKYYVPIKAAKTESSYAISNQIFQRFDFTNVSSALETYAGKLSQSQQTIASAKKIYFTSALDGPVFLETSLKAKDKRKSYDSLVRSDCNSDTSINGLDYATVIREYATPDFVPCDPDKNNKIDARDTSLIISNLGKKAE